jgi:glycine oxidase
MLPVDANFLSVQEPALAQEHATAFYMPEVMQVRNPRLLKALLVSIQHQCHLLETTSADSIEVRQGVAVGVHTSKGLLKASKIILAAGAWTALLLEKLAVQIPIEPVLGQMLLFRAEPGLIRHILLQEGYYLVPRRDGHILVGSTLENTAFNKRLTHEGYDILLKAALRLVPALENYPVIAHWAGLRPGSPQGIPSIGEIPTVKNLYLNAGHYRNGLAMAPASARLLANYLFSEPNTVIPACL